MTSRKAGEAAIQISARLGYAARGLVFVIVGGFAVLAALDARSPIVGTRGAMQSLLTHPFGRALLWAIAAGLFCFACWRAIQGIFDADNCGNHTGGVMQRLGFIGGAIFHLALAAIAIGIIFGSRRVSDEDLVARDWTAWLLGQPFGMWMVMLIGAGITAAGVVFAWKAVKGDFREHLAADVGGREWIVALGQFGYVARGVVLVIVGIFLMLAAWRFQLGRGRGTRWRSAGVAAASLRFISARLNRVWASFIWSLRDYSGLRAPGRCQEGATRSRKYRLRVPMNPRHNSRMTCAGWKRQSTGRAGSGVFMDGQLSSASAYNPYGTQASWSHYPMNTN